MGSRSTLLSAGCLALLPAAAFADETIRFREAWGWAVVVPVGVGAGVHEMLLDTGTTSTILEPGLAEEVGLRATAAANLLTPAGRRPVAIATVDLTLGSATLEGVEVVVAELPAIRSDEPRVRGILGQSALSRLEYTIDHAGRRLVVHRARATDESPPERVALQVQAAAPRPFVEARLDCGGPAVRLVLDSGVEAPVFFEGAHARPELELGASVHAETNAGDALWREARLRSLCVGGHRAGPLRVVVRPASAPARTEDGLLPSRFFARVRLGAQGTVLAVDPW